MATGQPLGVAEETLRERICRSLGCDAPDAEHKLLLWSMSWWRRPIWKFLNRMNPSLFSHDRDVIREAADARTINHVKSAIDDTLHYRGRSHAGFVRMGLGFRVSGRRLMDAASRFLPEPGT